MKKIFITTLLVLFSTNLFAYSTTGNITVEMVGYKAAKRQAVKGIFKKVDFKIKDNSSFKKFLKSASVKVDAYSIDTKMKLREMNIKNFFFKKQKVQFIKAKVVNVKGNDSKGILDIKINMNNVDKIIPLNYTVKNGLLEAKGKIDVLTDFMMKEGYASLAKKCKGLHAGKSYPDIDISFTLPIKK